MTELTIGAIIDSQPKHFCQDCGKSLAGFHESRKRCPACNKLYDKDRLRRRYHANKAITRKRSLEGWRRRAKNPEFRKKEAARLRVYRAKKKQARAPAE